jgi:hypothetical protein
MDGSGSSTMDASPPTDAGTGGAGGGGADRPAGIGGDAAAPVGGAGGTGSGAVHPAPVWSKRFASSTDDTVAALAPAGDRSFVVTGRLRESASLGGATLPVPVGESEGYLAKFDPQGNHLWSRAFGGSGHHTGLHLALDKASNIYLVASFRQSFEIDGQSFRGDPRDFYDTVLIKLDSSGKAIWSKQLPMVAAIGASDLGEVVVMGVIEEPADFGGGELRPDPGQRGTYVVRYDPAGKHLWSMLMPEPFCDAGLFVSEELGRSACSLVVESSGQIYLAGNFQLGISNAPLTFRRATGDEPALAENEGYSDEQFFHGWIAALAPDGKLRWARRTPYEPLIMRAMSTGGVVLVGENMNGRVKIGETELIAFGDDHLIARLNADGTPLWVQKVRAESLNPTAIAASTAGAVAVAWSGTGMFMAAGKTFAAGCARRQVSDCRTADAVVVGFSPTGTQTWAALYSEPTPVAGENSVELFTGLELSDDGQLLVAGQYQEKGLALGGPPLASVGDFDMFLASISTPLSGGETTPGTVTCGELRGCTPRSIDPAELQRVTTCRENATQAAFDLGDRLRQCERVAMHGPCTMECSMPTFTPPLPPMFPPECTMCTDRVCAAEVMSCANQR